MSPRRLLALALLALACRAAPRPGPVATLEGLELPLLPAPSLRLAVAGRVGGVPAAVELDPGAPLSTLTPGCGVEPLLQTPARVPNPFGGEDALALVEVAELSLGGAEVPPFQAALVDGPGCRVSLGDAALGRLAVELRLASRTVRLAPTRPLAASLAALPPGEEAVVVPVAREPRFDWPLVTVRVAQGASRWEGPLLLSAREPWTRLYRAPLEAAGLRAGAPAGAELPGGLARFAGLAADRLELAPGAGVELLPLELEPGEPPRLPHGVLGADVWGRFEARFDLAQGVLLLHRPRLEGAARCGPEGAATAEACLEVSVRRTPAGLGVGAVSWRPLPEGARLTLELPGPDAPCRVGLAFPPTGAGRSAWHLLPWGRLAEAAPACAAALRGAPGLQPMSFEDGPLEGCAGVCAFARQAPGGQTWCECQPARRSDDEAAARLLRAQAREKAPDAGASAEPEPKDP